MVPSPTWSIFRPVCSTLMPHPSPCLSSRPLYTFYGGLFGLHPSGGLSTGLPFPPVAFNPVGLAHTMLVQQQQQLSEMPHASSSSSSSPSPSKHTSATSPSIRRGERREREERRTSDDRDCTPRYPQALYRYHPYFALENKSKPPLKAVAIDNCSV